MLACFTTATTNSEMSSSRRWCGGVDPCVDLRPPLPNPTPYPPPPPAAPHVHRSVAGTATGSAVGAAVVLLAIISCLVVALQKRQAARRRSDLLVAAAAAATTTMPPSTAVSYKLPSSSIDVHPSQQPVAPLQAELQSIDVSPPPSSSSMSASTSTQLAASSNIYRQPQADTPEPREPPPVPADAEIVLFRGAFRYEELAAATNGFADSSLVGRGGFGDVYAGTIDGAAVAVKRLRQGSQQGDREFHAEVRIIARVHHRNLVSLVGYCVDDDDEAGRRRLLVYEYVPNMTLEYHLHGGVQSVLDWPTRWRIAVGAAKGLAYLHEDCHPRIIHRDIKAANILLDSDFNPKVSDFGMAKFIPGRETHISTRIVGTIGYVAPEYAISGRLTEKSDVFSFGVVLLELITGMSAAISSHPDTDDTLVGWARPLLTWALEHNSYDDLVDPLLRSFDADQMARLVRCATAAVLSSARRRPRMSQIVRHLEGDDSAEEIDGGAGSVGETEPRSADGETTVPIRYNDIRTWRKANR